MIHKSVEEKNGTNCQTLKTKLLLDINVVKGGNMKVIVRNPQFERQHVWFFEQPEFFEYEGEETKLKWTNPDEMCLTTGNPEWPVRVIQRRHIVSIDGKSVKKATASVITKVVKGSKGAEYVVTGSNGKWNCTCPGFQFRHNCKHTAELA